MCRWIASTYQFKALYAICCMMYNVEVFVYLGADTRTRQYEPLYILDRPCWRQGYVSGKTRSQTSQALIGSCVVVANDARGRQPTFSLGSNPY